METRNKLKKNQDIIKDLDQKNLNFGLMVAFFFNDKKKTLLIN